MTEEAVNQQALDRLRVLANEAGLNVRGGKVRRTSSRLCLGVEHGDYNGTELFGVGTDRFIWVVTKPNETDQVRLFSGNFPSDGVVAFSHDQVPLPRFSEIVSTWARFPYGVAHVLNKAGFPLRRGFDGVIYGNIPGGGMSRSASLCINLILSGLEVNQYDRDKISDFEIIDWAQAVENEYIGSPCGKLDQTMILLAKEGMGTHYNPKDRSVKYVSLGNRAIRDLRLVVLDTGTDRPGLEKSTYAVRRRECAEMVAKLQQAGYDISALADVREADMHNKIQAQFRRLHPDLCDRLAYIYEAQQRFDHLLQSWKEGQIQEVGNLFRQDGRGLRDLYKISGPELETMCDIARTVPGVLGERMLGGGDKGAAGALVRTEAVPGLKQAVHTAYPRSHPGYAQKFATHICQSVDGVHTISNAL